jgi:predicted RND superfamily exporter protein
MMDKFNDGSPKTLGDGYALDGQWQWHWIALVLVNQIFISVGVSLLLAYLILTIFVMNWIVSSISMLTLLGIISTFFAFLVVAGWTIGFEESILGIMVVGLAVDFTVHYAHSYCDCPDETREARVHYAFSRLGVSVISGGITTTCATILLVFAALIYFKKYGAMLAVTVATSWLYSNFFFMPMLALFGPEGEKGDLRPRFRALWARIRKDN